MAASRSYIRLLICSIVVMLLCAPVWALKLDGLKPGKTFRVDKIVFSGNHALSDSELLSQMTTKDRPHWAGSGGN
jgi:hypothetical protein